MADFTSIARSYRQELKEILQAEDERVKKEQEAAELKRAQEEEESSKRPPRKFRQRFKLKKGKEAEEY